MFFYFFGEFSWKHSKWLLIAFSTMEVEFVACYEATSHALWLRNFKTLNFRFHFKAVENFMWLIAVFFSKNNKSSNGLKAIHIKYLVMRERVYNQTMSIN